MFSVKEENYEGNWVTRVDAAVHKYMLSHGMNRQSMYVRIDESYPDPDFMPSKLYISRGMARDEKERTERVVGVNLWVSKNDEVTDGDIVYGFSVCDEGEYDESVEGDKDSAQGCRCIVWCTDPTVWDDFILQAVEDDILLQDDIGMFRSRVCLESYDKVKLPCKAKVFYDTRTNKLAIDINLFPDYSGERSDMGIYPDRDWTDVRPGWAVIDKVVYKGEHYAFVTGHMIETQIRRSVADFIEENWDRISENWIVTLVDYNPDDGCADILYSVPGDRGVNRRVYTYTTGDGEKFSETEVVHWGKAEARNVFWRGTFKELVLAYRFGFDVLVDDIYKEFKFKGISRHFKQFDLGGYAANNLVDVESAKGMFSDDVVLSAIEYGIIQIYNTSVNAKKFYVVPVKSKLYNLSAFSVEDFDHLKTFTIGANESYVEWIKEQIKASNIKLAS